MADKQTVLVTGCSSGFGKLAAETLARRGHTTIATMRGVEGKNADVATALTTLAEAESLPLHVLEMDVTDTASVEAAVARVLEREGRIDAVINNAGIGAFGVTEAFSPEQFHTIFNTNVLGSVRVNRAVLPAMRAAGRGLLVHVSTSVARVPMPFMGVYCASKAALEVMAEENRYLLRPFGIDSVIVEPSIYPTGILTNMMQPADGERMAGYGQVLGLMGEMGKAMEWALSEGPNPQEVADLFVALVEAEHGTRALRNIIGILHPPEAAELNQTTDRMIQQFYPMIGMAPLVQP